MQGFFELIDRWNCAAGAQRDAVESEIWQRYGVDRAVLVLDMSGFSLTVRRHGILTYLGMIRRMHLLCGPPVASHRGELVKHEADNLFAVFVSANDAVQAAIAIQRIMGNEEAHAPIRVGIGIDYGRILSIQGKDCFGDTVNTASKLGEDLAEPAEILITSAVVQQLDVDSALGLEPVRFSISGIEINATRVRY